MKTSIHGPIHGLPKERGKNIFAKLQGLQTTSAIRMTQ